MLVPGRSGVKSTAMRCIAVESTRRRLRRDKPLETEVRAVVERATVSATRIQILLSESKASRSKKECEAASCELTATRPRLASALRGAIGATTAIAKNVETPATRFAVRRCFRLGALGAARFEQAVASLHALDSLAHTQPRRLRRRAHRRRKQVSDLKSHDMMEGRMAAQGLKELAGTKAPKFGHFIVEFATPGIGHILKSAGCDFVLFDLEHSGFGFEDGKKRDPLFRGSRSAGNRTCPVEGISPYCSRHGHGRRGPHAADGGQRRRSPPNPQFDEVHTGRGTRCRASSRA